MFNIYEQLLKLKGDSYIIPGQVNVGVLIKGEECLLIDTGPDRDTGTRILSCLEKEGISPKVIINTHMHGGHCGGNVVFREKTVAKILAHPNENSGRVNCPEDGVILSGTFTADAFQVEIIALPGHSPSQIGVVTSDQVCFSGDAFFPTSILEQYGFPFLYDIPASTGTLRKLWLSRYDLYVPGHGSPTENVADIVLKNVASIELFLDNVLRILQIRDCTDEELITELIAKKNITLAPLQQEYFSFATAAYLAHLSTLNMIKSCMQSGKRVWKFCSSDG